MIYKPNFCCNCGEKIERVEWKFSNSRRFCDVCQSEYLVQDWLPALAVAAATFIGLFGIGSYLKAATAPPVAVLARPSAPPGPNRNAADVSNSARAANSSRPVSANTATDARPKMTPTPPVDEPAEFCGAVTKKGTACTRRVKGGGRCWQHKDQPATAAKQSPRAVP